MGIVKMSLANMQGKLNRRELKEVMAGSGSTCPTRRCPDYSCLDVYPCSYGTVSYCSFPMTHGGTPSSGLCTSNIRV